MESEHEALRRRWETASDERLLEALLVQPQEYSEAALAVLRQLAEERGLLKISDGSMQYLRGARPPTGPRPHLLAERLAELGRPTRCAVCGGESFAERRVLMNTRVMTFFDLDWLDESARGLVCEACGFIHWFD